MIELGKEFCNLGKKIYNGTKSMPDITDFLQKIDAIRVETQALLGVEHQSELGQFFTPPAVARTMAGMFSSFPAAVHLIDPGAGVGTLTAAFVSSALSSSSKPGSIKVTAFEIDPNLVSALRLTLKASQALCQAYQVNFKYEIMVDDFITSSVKSSFSQKLIICSRTT